MADRVGFLWIDLKFKLDYIHLVINLKFIHTGWELVCMWVEAFKKRSGLLGDIKRSCAGRGEAKKQCLRTANAPVKLSFGTVSTDPVISRPPEKSVSGKCGWFLFPVVFFVSLLIGVSTSFSVERNGDYGTRHPGNPAVSAKSESVYLYFATPDGRYLTGEIRLIDNTGDALVFCRQLIEALIAGPAGRGGNTLLPVLAPETRLLGVYIDNAETVYVDLTGNSGNPHPGGIRSELLSVYAIVNTLIVNIDGIDRVKILLDGNEAETFAGHIDIGYPVNAYMMLVR